MGDHVEPSPRQHVRDLDLVHGRTKRLQSLDGIADEIGKLVEGFAKLHEGGRADLIETLHPRCDRGRREVERVGGLLLRPAPCGAQLEDRHPFGRRIVRPLVRIDSLQAGVLDANSSSSSITSWRRRSLSDLSRTHALRLLAAQLRV